jgi:pyruvate/2-oxoglutarate dehydrogenase complex dihydrolipoamide dehydrogenase (E3) component
MRHDVVVLGGGPAGVTAALRARELGASVCLVERDRLGGVCTNTGCVPVRALARAARLLRDSELQQVFGLRAAAPELDFPALMKTVRETVEAVHEKKNLLETLQSAGVELLVGHGPARFVSANEVEVRGRRLTGGAFVVAVGGHARRPGLPGGGLLLLPTDLWGLAAVPRRLVVLGSGATGLQIASTFACFGARVAIVELAPQILPAADPDVSNAISTALTQHGVAVHVGAGRVERVEALGDGTRRVRLETAGTITELDADVVVAAVGWPANLDGLGLDAAGVEMVRGYPMVDRYQRTSNPAIYVAGDADGSAMLVQTAFYEALLAAENAVLGPTRGPDYLIVPSGGFTDPEYGMVGLTEPAARAEFGTDVDVETARYQELDRATIDRRRDGLCKLVVRKSTRRLLGAHVVGESATEVVQVAAMAMTGGASVEQVAALQFSYPTYCAVLGIASRRLARRLGQVTLPRPWGEMHGPLPEWERGGHHRNP